MNRWTSFQWGLFSLKCFFIRLTKKNPFKTGSYWDSLKNNSVGIINYNSFLGGDVLTHFLSKLTARNPKRRFFVNQALEHSVFFSFGNSNAKIDTENQPVFGFSKKSLECKL